MRALVLEDDEVRIQAFQQRFLERGWVGTFVTSARACIERLSSSRYDYVFLDHDLGGAVNVSPEHRNTGSAVARWWQDTDHPNRSARVIVHSANPVGAEYMAHAIYGSVRIPFVWTAPKFRILDEPECTIWDGTPHS